MGLGDEEGKAGRTKGLEKGTPTISSSRILSEKPVPSIPPKGWNRLPGPSSAHFASQKNRKASGRKFLPAMGCAFCHGSGRPGSRSEEHTSELQSLMRISYAVFCLKKKNKKTVQTQ